MSDSKNVAFRTAIGGYNREDVNKYILTLSRDFEKKEAELSARAAASDAAADTARAEVEVLQSALQAKDDAITALTAEKDELQSAVESLKSQLRIAEEKNDALTRELAAKPAANETDKSEKYDQISAQIGDLMISATTSADAIVAAANEQASRIMSDTESEANYIRSRLSDAADEMLSRISGELHTSTEHCIGELITALKEMRDNTDSMIRDFSKRSRDLSVKVEYYQSTVSDTVESALKEMDDKYGIRPIR